MSNSALANRIASSISDSDTTHAPDGNSVFDALALKAPSASPTFTGTPAVPTAAPSTNTTQAASTAYADTAVGNKTELHKSYTQTAHGFVAKDLLYWVSSNTYAKAEADSSTTSDVSLFVISVTDANTFVAASPGSVIAGLTGLTAGQQFLSAATAGAMTTTAPSTVGQVNAPVGVAINTTTFEFLVQRPYIIGNPAGVAYSVYSALMNQSGTADPVATVLQNTISGTIVWTRADVGSYLGTLSGVFTTNKVWGICQPGAFDTTTSVAQYAVGRLNNDSVFLATTVNSSGGSDDLLADSPIEIRIYN